jgi:hypothetical protein
MASLWSTNSSENTNNDNNPFNIKELFTHQKGQSYHEWYKQMYDYLLNNVQLSANGYKYQLIEIEFYYKSDNHYDTFVHCDKMQLNTCCQWYFHKQFGKSYKEGTYRGLDFTFGKEGEEYGGILLRSIKNIKTCEITEGSCKVVNEIFKACDNCTSVEEFVSKDNFDLNVNNSNSILHIENRPEGQGKEQIICCPRVGLTLNKYDHYKPSFIMKEYRFYTHPHIIQKYKSLAVITYMLTTCIDIFSDNEYDKKECKKMLTLFKITDKKAKEYKKMYDNALIEIKTNNINYVSIYKGKGLSKIGDLIALYAERCDLNGHDDDYLDMINQEKHMETLTTITKDNEHVLKE